MKASKPKSEPATVVYRGKLHRVPTLAEIARHCQQLVWELDPDAETVH